MVAEFRLLREHRRRASPSAMLLDGPHLIEEAVGAGVRIETVLVASDRGMAQHNSLADRLRMLGARVHEASGRVVQAASGVVTSQGIVAVAHRPPMPEEEVLDSAGLLLLVADGIQDPGNLGTMIRTAAAAGATAVAVTEGSSDPFLPKALRAAMGATFKVPLLRSDGEALRRALASRSVRVLVADPRGEAVYTEVPLRLPLAVVVGNEASGPDPGWPEIGTRVRIPLHGAVESLNVAVAAGLLLYEVARRRSGRCRSMLA